MLGLTACVGATERSDFEAEIRRRGGGVTTDVVSGPLDRLRAELGVADPELLLLSIAPADRVVVLDVRDPVERRNVDRYVSRNGGLGEPEPVQISAADDLDARSFRVSDIPALGDLEQLADRAIDAFGFADSYVEAISTGRRDNDPVLTVQVSSPRSEGTAIFDATGELLAAVPT